MRNILLTIEYDGTNYAGWQKQKEQVTIQDEIEKAIKKVTGEEVALNASGRTDAKVHANAQSANFFTNSLIKAEKIPFAINSGLPLDIRVLKAQEKDENFHARFSAKKKQYEYLILNRRVSSALLLNKAWHVPYALDLRQMEEGCKVLKGKHDFRAFMSRESIKEDTIREIYDISLEIQQDLIKVSVVGNGFLHNMVRIIVGTLILVGKGEISVSQLEEILESKDRTRAGKTAPGYGLYLKEVFY